MSDLLNVLPDFPVSTYSHIIPSLERNSITTVDLLSLGFADVARKAQIPPSDAKKLCAAVLGALQQDLGLRAENTSGDALKAGDGRAKDRKEDDGVLGGNVTAEDTAWRVITSGDSRLDDVLGGGIPTGYISEFVGER